MFDTVARYIANVGADNDRRALSPIVNAVADRLSSQTVTSGALAIKAGGSTLAKNGSVYYGLADGKIVTVAANTDMPALTGLTITANKFNVAVFYIDSAATVTVGFGTEGATANAVVFPNTPQGKAIIGFLLITHSSTFTGGTTALDTATTVYVNTVGAFDPSIKLA